ncbi:MAG: TIGR02206 family membrane protein [Actinobacteria bacterium]|nr:TIGR02206 family membrane protein [Actinomycetota bacterium]
MPVFSTAYVVTLILTALSSVSLIWLVRRHPGSWTRWVERSLSLVLIAVSVTWIVTTTTAAPWSWAYSLPLPLCDVATLVAAAGLWWKRPIWVELTYFWGLAGTLQALLTPDVNVGFPSLEFLEYVIAHAGIVVAALFLVVGERMIPRPKAAGKVYLITLGYTAVVGGVDAVTGGDYMFLRHPPSAITMLSVLGPWPWYIASAAGVAVVLLVALDAPFWQTRKRMAHLRGVEASDHLSHPFTATLSGQG